MPEALQITIGILTILGGLVLFAFTFVAARRLPSWPTTLLPVGAGMFIVHGWLDVTETAPDAILRSLLVTAGALFLTIGGFFAWKEASRPGQTKAAANRSRSREA